jgi:sulfate adenylyltransferase subunit 1 (EFTu-like GTPase family)
MMTGATQAQAAFLVIDATQGVKEQTKRHLHVLRMLGITQIGIVVNKMDLVDFSAHRFKQIKDAISGLFIQVGLRVIVVPVSAKKGDNILKMSKALGWYRGPTLMSICDVFSFVRQDRTGSLRLTIQDVYSIDGDNVYVGRLESGFVRGKQKVSLFPCGLSTQIRSLKIFGRAKMIARFGDNVGVILEDTLGVQRGEVICSMRDGLSIVCCFQGSLFWLAQNSLKVKDRVMVRCATQEVDGVVEEIKNSIDSSSLENRLGGAQEVKENELGVVIFKMEHPLVFDATGVTKELSRFAIEKDGKVCGFGIFSS